MTREKTCISWNKPVPYRSPRHRTANLVVRATPPTILVGVQKPHLPLRGHVIRHAPQVCGPHTVPPLLLGTVSFRFNHFSNIIHVASCSGSIYRCLILVLFSFSICSIVVILGLGSFQLGQGYIRYSSSPVNNICNHVRVSDRVAPHPS